MVQLKMTVAKDEGRAGEQLDDKDLSRTRDQLDGRSGTKESQ